MRDALLFFLGDRLLDGVLVMDWVGLCAGLMVDIRWDIVGRLPREFLSSRSSSVFLT